jgi:hypothetical protein
MIGIFMLTVAGLTSAAGYLLGVRRLGLAPARLGAVLGRMLETVGASLVFLVADLLVGVVLVVVLRDVSGRFVSVYVTNDLAWLGLAMLQGLVFQEWREASTRKAGAPALERSGNLG